MANMYNELWKRTEILQNSMTHSEKNTNATRKEIQNNLNLILKKLETGRTQNDNTNDGNYRQI